ncbi:cyclin H [Oratosquilla oratoria]|uniref:cyclin H n=1 Tax=Oratosquilla oratoria TaxID=337810 RepID=UPI003F766CED
MYATSTQLKSWTFRDEKELAQLRIETNGEFIKKYGKDIRPEEISSHFLTVKEEYDLVRFYEHSLRDFCRKFRDPRDSRIRMPAYVTATAQHYFKRFFLYNSVMDYHPKEILVTCVYLACKIEEFFVTINDFVHNLKGDQKKAAEIILNNELQLTQELQFHLIVHQPYRAVEGLLIDIKTRFPDLKDPERLRPYIEEFVEKVHLTDAIILYAPSQIALAAVTTAVSKLGENLDQYVTDILFNNNQIQLKILIEAVRRIKKMVKNYHVLISDATRREIEGKLEKCRNQQNNPNSSEYRANYADFDDDDLPLAMPDDPMEGVGIERITCRSPSF